MISYPFTNDQFFEIFRLIWANHNGLVWVLSLLAALPIFVGLVPSIMGNRAGLAITAVLWAVSGVMYHIVYFSAVSSWAYVFGLMFLAQAVALAFVAWSGPIYCARSGARVVGLLMMALSITLYPLPMVFAVGIPVPPFGIAPCPVVLFSMGFLVTLDLEGKGWLMAAPVIWAILGTSSAAFLGAYMDLMLPVYAIIMVVLHRRHLAQRRKARQVFYSV
jgi:hypothetical protein